MRGFCEGRGVEDDEPEALAHLFEVAKIVEGIGFDSCDAVGDTIAERVAPEKLEGVGRAVHCEDRSRAGFGCEDRKAALVAEHVENALAGCVARGGAAIRPLVQNQPVSDHQRDRSRKELHFLRCTQD